MNDSDHSSTAAQRPHHQDGDTAGTDTGEPGPETDNPDSPGQGLFGWVRNQLTNRGESLRESLQNALHEGSEEYQAFSDGERAMLANVLKLSEMRVEDVMVPRADIDAVDVNDSLGQAIQTLRDAGHSRLPVYDDTLDNITGMIHIKDALQCLTVPAERPNGSPIKLRTTVLKQKIGKLELTRRVLFVPPSMPVSDLLQSMQATRVHMAIVVDEYGGTDGLVTIEDMVEAVVGDIEDEHDTEDAALVHKEAENRYRADARASLEELQEAIGPDFDPGDIAEEADTLGGLIVYLTDRVPVRGEVITRMKGFEFEILQADPRRIRRVRITRRPRGLRVRHKPRAETGAAAPTADSTPGSGTRDPQSEAAE